MGFVHLIKKALASFYPSNEIGSFKILYLLGNGRECYPGNPGKLTDIILFLRMGEKDGKELYGFWT